MVASVRPSATKDLLVAGFIFPCGMVINAGAFIQSEIGLSQI